MMDKRKAIAAANARRRNAVEIAEAIDFDGTNDYLSRSSDLVGNADGKTFTFSAWVWVSAIGTYWLYATGASATPGFEIHLNAGKLQIAASNNTAIQANSSLVLPAQTWHHVLVSVDLTNTANRHVYLNDVSITSTFTWTTYANVNIGFDRADHYMAVRGNLSAYFKGRLAHLYLDYTYRDLSIEANRRLFITDDLKPVAKADVAALNPILYLPLDDPTAPGLNLGTGGDFDLNGVVARSGRGPNQYNVAYSDLDGAADYLSRMGSPAGVTDGKQFTFSCSFVYDGGTNDHLIYGSTTNLTGGKRFFILIDENNLDIELYDAAGNRIVNGAISASPNTFIIGRNYTLVISVDLNSTATRHVYVNGEHLSVTWLTYTNQNIDWSCPYWAVGATVSGSSLFNGRLGNVFFDTRYIDLSQPANLAKFVTGTGIDAKPVDLGANGEIPFGTPPLIYLPMRADSPGKNMGTGGDFTVNSGPFTGARGPSEYWGNKADFDGSTGYLARTSPLVGVSDGKTLSFAVWGYRDATSIDAILSNNGTYWNVNINNNGTLTIQFNNSAGTRLVNASLTSTLLDAAKWWCLMICIDLTDTSRRAVYINGVAQSVTWTTYTNADINLSAASPHIGAHNHGGALSSFFRGKLSEFFFTTEYIDFSQEANRLKFRDAFGNPVDLGADGSKPTGRAPEIYMRFDPSNFGANSGTGGDFTINGTITDGGQL